MKSIKILSAFFIKKKKNIWVFIRIINFQFFITSPSLFATIFSGNKRKSRREYQNSERTLTLHLCLRIMGWTCLAIFSSIFFASSCPGFFRALVSQTLWRSPKFIAEIKNYPKALKDLEAKVTKAWVISTLELWCSFVNDRWIRERLGKSFPMWELGFGIWSWKESGKKGWRDLSLCFLTRGRSIFFFFWLQITFFPSLLSAFKN